MPFDRYDRPPHIEIDAVRPVRPPCAHRNRCHSTGTTASRTSKSMPFDRCDRPVDIEFDRDRPVRPPCGHRIRCRSTGTTGLATSNSMSIDRCDRLLHIDFDPSTAVTGPTDRNRSDPPVRPGSNIAKPRDGVGGRDLSRRDVGRPRQRWPRRPRFLASQANIGFAGQSVGRSKLAV